MSNASAPASAVHTARQRMAKTWAGLSARDQRLVSLMGVVLTLALLWWVLIAPAVRMWRQAPSAHAQLDAQLQTLQAQAQQAKALQGRPTLPAEQAKAQVLQNASQLFGAQTTTQAMGDEVVVTLVQTSSAQLAQGLHTLRSNANAVVAQAQLQAVVATPDATAIANAVTPATSATKASPTPPPTDTRLWSGTLRLRLPPTN